MALISMKGKILLLLLWDDTAYFRKQMYTMVRRIFCQKEPTLREYLLTQNCLPCELHFHWKLSHFNANPLSFTSKGTFYYFYNFDFHCCFSFCCIFFHRRGLASRRNFKMHIHATSLHCTASERARYFSRPRQARVPDRTINSKHRREIWN